MKKKFTILISLIIFLMMLNPVLSQINSNYSSLFNGANSMLVAGNFKEAIKLYNQAIQKSPDSYEAYLGLSIAYKESGQYQEAYNAVNYVIKLKPNYYQAYYNLGIILEKLERKEEAIKAYEKFLKEVPGAERFSDANKRILKLKNIRN